MKKSDAPKNSPHVIEDVRPIEPARTRIPNLDGKEISRLCSVIDSLLVPKGPTRARQLECIGLYVAQLIQTGDAHGALRNMSISNVYYDQLSTLYDDESEMQTYDRVLLWLTAFMTASLYPANGEFELSEAHIKFRKQLASQTDRWPMLVGPRGNVKYERAREKLQTDLGIGANTPFATTRPRLGRGRPPGANSERATVLLPLLEKIAAYRRADDEERANGDWIRNYANNNSLIVDLESFTYSPYQVSSDKREIGWQKAAASLPVLTKDARRIEAWKDALCELINFELGPDYIRKPVDPKELALKPFESVFVVRNELIPQRARLVKYIPLCLEYGPWPQSPLEPCPQSGSSSGELKAEPLSEGALAWFAAQLDPIPQRSEQVSQRQWWDTATPSASKWLWLASAQGYSQSWFEFVLTRPNVSVIGESGANLEEEIRRFLKGLAK